jgi:phosphatidate cytidylyltransferase
LTSVTAPEPVAPPPSPSRAGRNLPAAIAVGVGLGGAVVVTLFTVRWAFIGLATVLVMAAGYELCRALGGRLGALPAVPLAVGSGAVLIAAYVKGTQVLVVGVLLLAVAAVAAAAVGEFSDRVAGIGASVFVVVYITLLAGFVILLAIPDDGPRRVVALVATVACSDTGGYAVGVLFGKHPIAPSVSPKKSWEGFAGSVAACALCGGLFLPLALHATWWQGIVFGLAVVLAATVGDFAESLLKRDLGIKDMGHLLPGHGGVLDRFDSLLLSAPVAWALLTAFVAWP